MHETNLDIPLRVAQHVIDAMNNAVDLEGTECEKAEFLLCSLQAILHRRTFGSLLLLEELRRKPAPRVVHRYSFAADEGLGPVYDDEEVQDGVNQAGPALRMIIPRVLAMPRVPLVFVYGQDTPDREWVEREFQPRVRACGYEDIMVGVWAACPDRAIAMTIMQRTDARPFDESDRSTMSLMLRAVAPFVDREIFGPGSPLLNHGLTERQLEVLLLLLTGDSEKEIALRLHRSIHTVHTHVKQLYEKFSVSSRGELMARFIDEAVSKTAQERKQAGPV
jgi:DNA-binding CsgD family transcriptional regulator